MVKLGELCTKIGSGATPRGGQSVYQDSGIALVRSQNILDLQFSDHGLAFISDEAAEALRGVTLKKNDVLINITGDSTARVAIWDGRMEARVNQHVSIIRPKGKLLNSRWLTYFLVNPKYKEYLLTLASSGGSRPALTRGMLAELEIPEVDLREQRAIVDVLGALDDKIAANQWVKTISYQLICMIGSTIKEFVPLGEVAELDKRIVTPEMMNGKSIQLHSIPGFDQGKPEFVDGETIKSGKFLLAEPRVLVSKLNPLTPRIWNARVADEVELSVCSTEFIPFSSNRVPNSALYSSLVQPEFSSRLSECASGTSNSHQRVKPEDMLVTPIRDPRAFTSVQLGHLEALDALSYALTIQNRTLAITRDELLPFLMNGKITVAEAKDEVEALGVDKHAEGAGDV